ncbi:phage holin family protein [Patescibacteria group bacterium]|nr:phage holin family protein [Patescibacteria group bacterium]
MFWIINDVLRNIIQTITLPFKFLTLGLSSIIINIGVIYLFEYVVNTYIQNISV